MLLSDLLLLLVISGCGTTLAIWFTWHLWHPPRHTLPAAAVGMAAAVLVRLAVDVAFNAYPDFGDVILSDFYGVVGIIVPVFGATLGVAAWRAFEVWHEHDMTVAGMLGLDDNDAKISKPSYTGGGHFGVKAQLPPSPFGAKRKPRK